MQSWGKRDIASTYCKRRAIYIEKLVGIICSLTDQEVLNPTPLNPTPATCHTRKRKLRCSFWNAALQKLHCNICFSAVRTSFVPEAALQQTKNCTATSKSLRCRKVALSCRFPAGFKPPCLGTHVSDLLTMMARFARIGPSKRVWGSTRKQRKTIPKVAKKQLVTCPLLLRVPQEDVGKRNSITFSVFGTLSVTFWSLLLTLLSLFSSLFCQTPFAGLFLRQSELPN